MYHLQAKKTNPVGFARIDDDRARGENARKVAMRLTQRPGFSRALVVPVACALGSSWTLPTGVLPRGARQGRPAWAR